MNRREFTTLAAALIATPLSAIPALAAGETPTQIVQAIYRTQIANDKNPKSPSPDSKSQRAKFFSKRLITLLEADDKLAAKNGQGKLDFSPYHDGQDGEINALKVGDAEINGDRAIVRANFKNFEKPTEITFELTLENGNWRVSNIRGNGSEIKWDLVSYITRKD